MKKQKKSLQNGITLIALVITIIVLLILAGVSISLVVGENGILNKATNSVDATRKGSAMEQVSMAWSACQTDYLASGGTTSKSTCFSKENLTANLGEGEVTKASIGVDEAGTSELVYKVKDTYYKMQVTADGEVSIVGEGASTEPTISDPVTPPPTETAQTLVSQISANNYGDYVDYNVDLGLTLNLEGETAVPKTDWRIFYKGSVQKADGSTEDRVYLIAADYVPNNCTALNLSGAGMKKNGTYSVYWSSAPSALADGETRKDSVFGITSSSYTLNGSNPNSKCVSKLLDTSNWSKFVNTIYADYAIGGPTLEMYTNSWNAKGYTNMTPSSDASWSGYKVNNGTSVNMSSNAAGYGNNLYYPHKTDSRIGSEGCYGYWLASPDAYNTYDVVGVGCHGVVGRYDCGNRLYGVRPVVSLQSGVKAIKNPTTGIWELSE